MRAPTCARLFEAEARRDGRLTGAERASFERHLATCAACAAEVRALDTLGEGLRAGSEGKSDDLRVRRERTRLLAAFDQTLVGASPRPKARVILSAAAAVVLVATLAFAFRHRPSVVAKAPASTAMIRAVDAAIWSEHAEDDADEIDLRSGTLSIHVDHALGDRRLRVQLPDGELEDIGTTFTVTAENGHTAEVVVREGRVALRLEGRPAVLVGAGELWRPDVGMPAASATMAPVPVPEASAQPSTTAAPSARATPTTTPKQAADASAEFRVAMDALDRGDNHQAATAFAAFLAAHPDDSRAEDAAYLRVIALQKSGDDAHAKRAAEEYLETFPSGFRRAEVERLAR